MLTDVRGPFNLAADPVVDARLLGELLDARVVATDVLNAVLRGAAHGDGEDTAPLAGKRWGRPETESGKRKVTRHGEHAERGRHL